MVRVGGIHDRLLFNKNITDNKSGMNDLEQLSAIHHDLIQAFKKKRTGHTIKSILGFSANTAFIICGPNPSPNGQSHFFGKYFDKEILPYLFPSVVEQTQ